MHPCQTPYTSVEQLKPCICEYQLQCTKTKPRDTLPAYKSLSLGIINERMGHEEIRELRPKNMEKGKQKERE